VVTTLRKSSTGQKDVGDSVWGPGTEGERPGETGDGRQKARSKPRLELSGRPRSTTVRKSSKSDERIFCYRPQKWPTGRWDLVYFREKPAKKTLLGYSA